MVTEGFDATMHQGFPSASMLQESDPLDRVLGCIDFLNAKTRNPWMSKEALLGTLMQERSQQWHGYCLP